MTAVLHSQPRTEPEPPSYIHGPAPAMTMTPATSRPPATGAAYAASVFTNASTLFAGMGRGRNDGPSSYFVQVKRKANQALKGRGRGYKDWVLCYATVIRSGNDDNSDILIHLVPSDADHNPSAPPRVILWLSSTSISLSRDQEKQSPLKKLLSAISVGHCTLKCYSYIFPDRAGTNFRASSDEEDWSFAGFGLTNSLEKDGQAKAFLEEVRKLLGWRNATEEEEE